MGERRFRWWLAALLAVGLAVRLGVALVLGPEEATGLGDGTYYHLQANLIADGRGFTFPELALLTGGEQPDAQHPPLFPLLLSIPSLLGLGTMATHQVVGVAIGTVGALLVALLARKVAGDRAALIAAALAVLYPALWVHEVLVLSESLLVALTAGALLAALRFKDRPTAGRAAVVGALLGLAALTRAEQVLLLPLVGGWMLLVAHRAHVTVRSGLAMSGAFVVLLAPWVGWNLIRFEQPTYVSTQLGVTEAVASCDSTFDGEARGLSDVVCGFDRTVALVAERTDPASAAAYVTLFTQRAGDDDPLTGTSTSVPPDPEVCAAAFPDEPRAGDPANPATCLAAVEDLFERVGDASEISAGLSDEARSYVGDRRADLPAVAATRVGALWGAYPPSQHVDFDVDTDNRPRALAWAAWIGFYGLVPVAVLGGIALRRRRRPLFLLLTPAIVATVTAAAFFGSVRFRAGADVSLVVLAAVGLAELWVLATPPPDRGPPDR